MGHVYHPCQYFNFLVQYWHGTGEVIFRDIEVLLYTLEYDNCELLS